jgi:hypothetical protein
MGPFSRMTLICLALCSMIAQLPEPADAHSWYPKECCRNDDCAPVDSVVQVVPVGGGKLQLIVTSRHGTALIPQDFPMRESQDGRMHVCMRADPYGGKDVMCFFTPPGM